MNHLGSFPRFKIAHLAFFLALIIHAGCSKAPVVAYTSIVGFDGHSNEYALIYMHLVDGKPMTQRLTVTCASYQWGDREVLSGPTVCKLVVGSTLKENLILGRKFLSMYLASSDKLSIMEGIGPNRVIQQFNVLKQEVVDPK